MYVEQLYTGCLAEAAYYIESEGEAAIIDPLRETEPYLEMAEKRGATIKYVFETHFHADFVSGHVDLAAKTGAKIIYGPNAETAFTSYVSEDGEEFQIGNLTMKVLHTPGHTMESTTYLLKDGNGKAHAIFTGDTLFIGDVGRPDLAVKSDLTQEDLAGLLYESLHSKILTLDDEVIVYPGHGEGSACGKNMSKETVSTVGQQRELNYALKPMSKEDFIEVVTEGLEAPPAYFPENAIMNKMGYENIDEVIEKNKVPLNAKEVKREAENGALILDTRNPDDFEQGFIPGAINIGLDGQYAPWVGALIPIRQRLVLVTYKDKAEEAVIRLARVGFTNVAGYVEGGIENWAAAGEKIDTVTSIEPVEYQKFDQNKYTTLDVRRTTEAAGGMVKGAKNISLVDLEKNFDQLDENGNYMVHCAGGYRSMIAASMLKKHGITNTINIKKGIKGLKEAGVQEVMPQKSDNELVS